MKKHNSPRNRQKGTITVGMDLGDRSSRWCLLDAEGNITAQGGVATTKRG